MATETPKAAEAFLEYANLGPSRSLAKLAEIWKPGLGTYSSKLRQLQTWSAAYAWQERVKALDAERIEAQRLKLLAEEDEKRRKKAAAIEAMNERHAQIGVTQQKVAVEQIQRLAQSASIGPYAAVQLLKLATDLERLARGEATSIERSEGTVEVKVVYVNDWRQNSIDDTPPDAPSWADSGQAASTPIQLAQRGASLAKDHPGNGNQRRRRSTG